MTIQSLISTEYGDTSMAKINANFSELDTLKASDSSVVHKTGDENIAGIKTFSSSPVVPTPTTGTQAVNKSYADLKLTIPGAWSNYSPTANGGGGSGATLNIIYAKSVTVGKALTIQIRATITSKGTCTGDISISAPTLATSYGLILTGGIFAIGATPNQNKGWVVTDSTGFKFTAVGQSALLNWTGVSVGDEIIISGTYEIT